MTRRCACTKSRRRDDVALGAAVIGGGGLLYLAAAFAITYLIAAGIDHAWPYGSHRLDLDWSKVVRP